MIKILKDKIELLNKIRVAIENQIKGDYPKHKFQSLIIELRTLYHLYSLIGDSLSNKRPPHIEVLILSMSKEILDFLNLGLRSMLNFNINLSIIN